MDNPLFSRAWAKEGLNLLSTQEYWSCIRAS